MIGLNAMSSDSVAPGPPLPGLPRAVQFDFAARDGQTYRLLVDIPDEQPPASGFPLVVLLDGHALFATAAMAVRLQAGRPEVTGVGPAVVLGIGYLSEAPFDAERRQQDLLPVAGRSARFLDTIADEILPAIERLAPLDPARRTLIGHSYGGLFVLHALFTRAGLFQAHVASSPSIWWDDRAILGAEEAFRNGAGDSAARLLITVGAQEQDGAVRASPWRAERLAMARMRDNAAEMAGRLSASGRVSCTFTVFPDENHVSVIPPMLSRAVSFGLAGTAAQGTATA
jgi:predicted alpha/beta superfamily hydrolase